MSKTRPECDGPCPMERKYEGKNWYRCKKCGYEIRYYDPEMEKDTALVFGGLFVGVCIGLFVGYIIWGPK